MKKILFPVIRFILTALILIFIFKKIDILSVLSSIKNSNLVFIFASFIAMVVFTYILALRWQMILSMYGFKTTVWKSFKIYMIALFFNNFLPSTVGMDIVRGAYIAGGGKKLSDVVSSILIERWIGLLGIIFYVSFVPLFFIGKINLLYFLPLSAGGILLSLLFFISISNDKVFGFFFKTFSKIGFLKIGDKINSLFLSLRLIKDHKKQLFVNLFLSFMIQVVFVFTNYFIVLAQNLQLNLTELTVYIPFISVISMIPVTINGLGLREWSYITLFAHTPKEQAVALSLSFFAISVLLSMLGGIFFLTEKKV